MSGYKVVPVEPTLDMERAAESYWNERRFKGLSDDSRTWAGVYQAMLDAAPAVQGEPVGWQFYQDGKWWHGDDRIKDHRKNTEEAGFRVRDVYAAPQPVPSAPTFQLGDHVRKTKGSQWKGRVVGTYSTTLTPEGYAVESDTEKGSVQIYPVGALEMATQDEQPVPDVADYEQVLEDQRRLTRELDVLLNGEEGAAQQASLCDLVAQLRTVVKDTGKPILAAPDVAGLVEALENMLGAFDTPIIRRKVGSVFSEEAIGSAHAALAAHRKQEST